VGCVVWGVGCRCVPFPFCNPSHPSQITSVISQTTFWSLSSPSPSLSAPYTGPPLPPSSHFTWRVRIRTSCLHLHSWSRAHMFITALDEWSAVYITRPPPPPPSLQQFSRARSNFTLPCHIAAASLHISGIGYSAAFVNGIKVGDHELSPTWTRYDKMVVYVTHDVTHMLHARNAGAGAMCDHVIDVMLGSGHFSSDWYGGPLASMLMAQINAFPSSSSPPPSPLPPPLVVAPTGISGWVFTCDGPIVSSSVYGGETFNATAEHREDEWVWLPAVCAPPMPQHPSEPNSRKSKSASSSSPTTPTASPPPTIPPTTPLSSHDPPPSSNCSLPLQLNGSSLVPQRQVRVTLHNARWFALHNARTALHSAQTRHHPPPPIPRTPLKSSLLYNRSRAAFKQTTRLRVSRSQRLLSLTLVRIWREGSRSRCHYPAQLNAGNE